MIYRISRASYYGNDASPCDAAFKHDFDCWMVRTCNEEEFNNILSQGEGLWRDSGSEHHVTQEGYICKKLDEKDRCWAIEINTLGELNDFIVKNGDIVISEECKYSLSLEIYDAYRE